MRFGLFSSAAPLAISDDSMFPEKKGKFQMMKPKFESVIWFDRFNKYSILKFLPLSFNIARRDEEGAVIIAPKNITTNNVKKGGIDKCLFSHPTYNAVGEPYQEASKAM